MIERSAPPRIFSAIVAAVLLLALVAIVLYAPREAVQGDAQKILYVHVGSAAAAYLSFLVTAGASIGTLIWRSERMDQVARSAALVGVFLPPRCWPVERSGGGRSGVSGGPGMPD